MSTEETIRHIGRNERDFIIAWMETILGSNSRIGILGRDFFIERPADCLYWIDTLRRTLVAEWDAELSKAKKLRAEDERRGIKAWQTFRTADKCKAELARFDAQLADARKADADRLAEREAKRKGGDAPAEAPAAPAAGQAS